MQATHDRRKSDAKLNELESRLEDHEGREERDIAKMLTKLDRLHDDITSMSEILTAWNNAKGFVQTIQAISKVLAVVAVCASPFVAFGYYIKTGQWK